MTFSAADDLSDLMLDHFESRLRDVKDLPLRTDPDDLRRAQSPPAPPALRRMMDDDLIGLGDLPQCFSDVADLSAVFFSGLLRQRRLFGVAVCRWRLTAVPAVQSEPTPQFGVLQFESGVFGSEPGILGFELRILIFETRHTLDQRSEQLFKFLNVVGKFHHYYSKNQISPKFQTGLVITFCP